MIKEETLKLSVYEYFKYCLTKKTVRGVGVITDKQSIFYSQIDENDFRAHEWVACDIEDIIHPNDKREGWAKIRDENVHFFSIGRELIVDLPTNDQLTISQYNSLVDVLKQVKQFNQENPKYKIWIFISTKSNYLQEYNQYDIDYIIEQLKNLIKKDNYNVYEEKIIGIKRDETEIINNLKYTIDLESVKTFDDLTSKYYIMEKYYKDSFYHKYLLKIFPNFLKFQDQIRTIHMHMLKNTEINTKLDFNNLIDTLDKLILKINKEIEANYQTSLKDFMIKELNIENIKNTFDLNILFQKLDSYYFDDTYKKFILELIPNYSEIQELYELIKYLRIEKELSNISFNTLKNTLESLLENCFINKNLVEIQGIVYRICLTNYKKYFKNIELLKIICFKFYLKSDMDKINELLLSATSYQDVFNIIINSYQEMVEREKEEYINSLSNNDNILKMQIKYELVRSNFDKIKELKAKKDELNELLFKVSNTLSSLNIKKEYLESRSEVDSIDNKINILESKKERLQNKINEINQEFYRLTGLEEFEFDLNYLTYFIEYYNNINIKEIENQQVTFQETIKNLEVELEKIDEIIKDDSIKK